jgi:hypothetical protein
VFTVLINIVLCPFSHISIANATSSYVLVQDVSILFPPTTVLKLDRTYHWAVAFYCDTNERVDSPFLIQGQIQGIAAPTALTTAKSPLESIQILAENGIWYDALTQLGDRFRHTKDRQTATNWTTLLKSAGISGAARIQDCCQ